MRPNQVARVRFVVIVTHNFKSISVSSFHWNDAMLFNRQALCCVRQNAFYIRRCSFPWVLRCSTGIHHGCQVISEDFKQQ